MSDNHDHIDSPALFSNTFIFFSAAHLGVILALIVQKYGGSSLADPRAIREVASRIRDTLQCGCQVVAVVSAMGDTTDTLISLATQVSEHPEPRELDVLLSTGEIVSSTLTAMALRSQGLDAISLTGAQAGIRTDTSHGKARIASVQADRIRHEVADGKIVVVAGFQGITDHLEVTTMGRGASDLSAVALAAELSAERCEIYTDVAGIYTADPKLVSQARCLPEIGYEEMLELASYGAKMNPRSIELGMVYNVPIKVSSSFEKTLGTLITRGAAMDTEVGEIRNRVRGIATDVNVAKISILGVPDQPAIQAKIFEPLADAGISVDVIVQNISVDGATDVTFTVTKTDLNQALAVVSAQSTNLQSRNVVSASNLAKVSIVGTGMQNSPGYASKMFRSLADAGISISMIATSEIRITCIVEEDRIGDAATALHKSFELDQPDPE